MLTLPGLRLGLQAGSAFVGAGSVAGADCFLDLLANFTAPETEAFEFSCLSLSPPFSYSLLLEAEIPEWPLTLNLLPIRWQPAQRSGWLLLGRKLEWS